MAKEKLTAENASPEQRAAWSRIGRKSRRKGKKYECVIAGVLRETTGLNWQSTRNSGRTDLKGDVYCVNDANTWRASIIECKNRVDFQPLAMLQGNAGYMNEIAKVRLELRKTLTDRLYGTYVKVIFVRLHLFGDMIGVLDGDVDEFLNSQAHARRPGVIAADGTKYRLLRGLPLQVAECERLFGCSCPE